jgi:hypothetical protein
LDLRWEHVDLGRGLLLLPDSKTSRKTSAEGPELEILKARRRIGPFVMVGDKLDQARSDLKKPWSAMCRHAGLEGVRWHDLRSGRLQ